MLILPAADYLGSVPVKDNLYLVNFDVNSDLII